MWPPNTLLEMAHERKSLATECKRECGCLNEECQLLEDKWEAKIAALEEGLAHTCAELDNECQLCMIEKNES